MADSLREPELLLAIHETGLRLRDFRADALRRFQKGDARGVLAQGLLEPGELAFVEDGRVRVSFRRGVPSGLATDVLRVRCGDGFWLTLQ